MKELPGDVFVTGQLLSAQMQALSEQGVMSFVNNRPDMEAPIQPLSEELESTAQNLKVDYFHIPMSGGISPGLIEARSSADCGILRIRYAVCCALGFCACQ